MATKMWEIILAQDLLNKQQEEEIDDLKEDDKNYHELAVIIDGDTF